VRVLAQESPEWLQRITRRRGQKTERLFWQSGGGYDRNIDEPTTLAREIEYLHMNPVRRGLVERAVDWNWSSAGWFEGRASALLAPDTIPAEWIA
jgi:putative transposase